MNESCTACFTIEGTCFDCTEMTLCTRCFRLRGPCNVTRAGEDEDLCATLEHDCSCSIDRSDKPSWPRYDFNEAVCLCHCCGAVLLPSGSRWSVWFCEDCKHKIVALNKLAGNCLIPIGRHSTMNGISFQLSADPQPQRLQEFHSSLENFFALTGATAAYAVNVVQNNCKELGIVGTEGVSLPQYLEGVSPKGRESTEPFVELCQAFQIPVALSHK